jgi:hypothetical protein
MTVSADPTLENRYETWEVVIVNLAVVAIGLVTMDFEMGQWRP